MSNRRKPRRSGRRLRILAGILFVFYLLLLIYLVFFVYVRQEVMAMGELQYNLVPFREIGRYYHYQNGNFNFLTLTNLYGNILMFMPFGFLLPAFVPRLRRFFPMVILAFFASLLIELMQLYTHRGVFDVDDIILNTIGGAVGTVILLIAAGVRRFSRKR